LQRGQLFPADKQRVLTQMKGADILVEVLSGPTEVMDDDSAFRRELDLLCLTDITPNFQIWWRHPSTQRPQPAKPIRGDNCNWRLIAPPGGVMLSPRLRYRGGNLETIVDKSNVEPRLKIWIDLIPRVCG
jgi:hypothetical protein